MIISKTMFRPVWRSSARRMCRLHRIRRGILRLLEIISLILSLREVNNNTAGRRAGSRTLVRREAIRISRTLDRGVGREYSERIIVGLNWIRWETVEITWSNLSGQPYEQHKLTRVWCARNIWSREVWWQRTNYWLPTMLELRLECSVKRWTDQWDMWVKMEEYVQARDWWACGCMWWTDIFTPTWCYLKQRAILGGE